MARWIVLLTLFVLAACGDSAPDADFLRDRLAAQLPRYATLTGFQAGAASQVDAGVTIPVTATARLDSALYLQDGTIKGKDGKPVPVLTQAAAEGDIVNFAGTAHARDIANNWQVTFTFSKISISTEARPRAAFPDDAVIKDSPAYRELAAPPQKPTPPARTRPARPSESPNGPGKAAQAHATLVEMIAAAAGHPLPGRLGDARFTLTLADVRQGPGSLSGTMDYGGGLGTNRIAGKLAGKEIQFEEVAPIETGPMAARVGCRYRLALSGTQALAGRFNCPGATGTVSVDLSGLP